MQRSDLRHDFELVRRHMHYRLFGMEFQFGGPNGKEYKFVKPKAANKEFVRIFEKLLSESWKAIVNSGNSSGINTSDRAAIADMCKSIQNMMRNRRKRGNLAQEEFRAVMMAEWFALTQH